MLRSRTLTPHKIRWIRCSVLKFSQLRDVVHRIRAPYLCHFETLYIVDYSDFYWPCFDCT